MHRHRYSIFILAIELLGTTAVFPYALLNAVHSKPTGSKGLPADDGVSEPNKKWVGSNLWDLLHQCLDAIHGHVSAYVCRHGFS